MSARTGTGPHRGRPRCPGPGCAAPGESPGVPDMPGERGPVLPAPTLLSPFVKQEKKQINNQTKTKQFRKGINGSFSRGEKSRVGAGRGGAGGARCRGGIGGQKLSVLFLPSLRGERRDPGAGAAAPRCGTELRPTLGTRGARDSRRVCPRSGRGPSVETRRDPNGRLKRARGRSRGVRRAAGCSLMSGTRQERTRGRVGRAGWTGMDPPVSSGRPPSPQRLRQRPRRCPGERGTGGPAPVGAPRAATGASAGGRGGLRAPPPHLGSAGRGKAPLPFPSRRGPAPATSRLPRARRAPSEVRG